MIVTTTPTIMDGQVLRWYLSEAAAKDRWEIVSASRNSIIISGDPHLTDTILGDARRAHRRLAAGEDVTDMATHRRGPRGSLIPLAADPAEVTP